jgi:hypothetical protein
MSSFNNQFGLMVAYLLPGFIALAGVARLVPAVARWLQPTLEQGSTGVGPPVYAVLAATALGMILSCFRWILIDHAHHLAGVRAPQWDVDRLEARLSAFTTLVEYHYRYYQFYANTLIAIVATYLIYRALSVEPLGVASDIGVVVVCAALFAGSRDALSKYYARTEQLIGQIPLKGSDKVMTNGCHHEEGGAPAKKQPQAKPQPKRESKPEPNKLKAPAK